MPLRWLLRLWERLGVQYGSAWEQDYGDSPVDEDGRLTTAGEVWRDGLFGLTADQLHVGLQRSLLAHPEWPPRVGQFRALCMCIPTLTEIRLEERARPETLSPFLTLVRQHLDMHRYRMDDARTSERLLREAYEVAREHVLRGGALPEPIAGYLPTPQQVAPRVPPPERRQELIDQARAELGLEAEPENAAPPVGREAAAGPDR